MLYALNIAGEKVPATPGGRAACPVCGSDVIAKCGPRLAKHWAHKRKAFCDPWHEETAWHIAWKSIVRRDRCEVVLRHGGFTHRADIVGNRNTVIELQHSPIPPGELQERERFYGKMIWVFDAAGFFGNTVLRPVDDYVALSWHYPRMTLVSATKPVYFHLPCGNIFKLEHAYRKRQGEPLRCWGRSIGWKPFFHLYLSSVVEPQYGDGEQPEAIKKRIDTDISKLRFRYSDVSGPGCGCESREGFPNCDTIRIAAKKFQIRRLLDRYGKPSSLFQGCQAQYR